MIRSKWFALLCSLALLAACSTEVEYPDEPNADGTYKVSFRVETKASPSDQLAKDDEYINSLVVLVTRDDRVIKRWDALKDGVGKTKEWASEEGINLAAGRYVAYAFANMESLPEGEDSFLSDIKEGDDISSLDEKVITMFSTNTVYDPINGKYLPMSRRYPFSVNGNRTEIIPLLRMVSRVEVSVLRDDSRTEIISDFTFTGYSDKMNLFVDPYELNDEDGNSRDALLEIPNITMVEQTYRKEGNLEDETPFYFYVSETKGEFKVNLKLNDTSIEERTLKRNVLVRNRVWPIVLVIKNTKCVYDFVASNQPIGGAPETVEETQDETGSYNIDVKGGGNFTLTLKAVEWVTKVGSIQIKSWNVESEYSKDYWSFDGNAITGRVPSHDDSGVAFNVTATDEDGAEYNFTFNITSSDLFSK